MIVSILPSGVKFTGTDTESLLKRSGFLKVIQLIHFFFFKLLYVKIEVFYPSAEIFLLKSQLLLLGDKHRRKTIKAIHFNLNLDADLIFHSKAQ